MLDFLMISTRSSKRGQIEIYPNFIIKRSSDLMIRGGDFYAVWMEDKGVWSTDEQDVIQMIDKELDDYYENNKNKFESNAKVLHMWDSRTGMIDDWHKYVQRQLRDNAHQLDRKLVFLNDKVSKKDYATKRLPYPLEPCPIPNYEKLVSTLYDPEERAKIEWAIGAMITGASKSIQKFLVFYGETGAGKSTIINIMQKLFDGYYSAFDSKALGSASNQFAVEALKDNPILAIQHDGDLSHIEDNYRINSITSHEEMTINVKFRPSYQIKIESFLVLGTNKPVKITDAKSGLIRRLIDVHPSGRKFPIKEYKEIVKGIDFELGGIACHCRDVYNADPYKYDDYVPMSMIGATNDFYNFVLDSYFIFKNEDSTTLTRAWDMYKLYCSDANVPYPLPRRAFKEELKNYFKEYHDRFESDEEGRFRSYYSGFKTEKFETIKAKDKPIDIPKKETWLEFKKQESLFDKELAGCLAQYGTVDEVPSYKWKNIKTNLGQINTSKLHYVKVPENHIVIDFDIPDENGEKSFELNLEEASKWPRTYAELSKSGKGIHLHYIYSGDPSTLSSVYADHIEVKVFSGNSSLRRKLTKCNDIPIASISSGLPLKGEKKVIDIKSVNSEKSLRKLIGRNLNKEIHASTKSSVDFIYKLLEDAYNSGMKYDVSNMRNSILAFAANSTHHASYLVNTLIPKMHFKSNEPSDNIDNEDKPIAFYDVEVYPNLFLVCWKLQGKDKPVVRMYNPKPDEVEEFIQNYRLIGFNCRRYDNHILYAKMMGYSEKGLFDLSQKIIDKKSSTALFSEAYNLSYTDVYDFCSVKQSLKKWEIALGIHHQEMGIPWDQPVPEELWLKVGEYCDNDVIATEAVFDARKADFVARQIQVELVKKMHDITNVSVNDTTNTLSTKIIFGKNKEPQSVFNYRNLSDPVSYKRYSEYRELFGKDYEFRIFDDKGLPQFRTYDGKEELPKGWSILPFFPGYKFELGKSTYLDQEIGEGGRVYSEPGMYANVWDGDVASMHPHSIIYECLFGPEYTARFNDIVKARVAIKHKDFEAAGSMLDGALKPFLNEDQAADLAQALKIVINSIYGLTSASFTNAFKDERNIDNIVAKRGALFMTLLKDQVEKQGYKVAHIKTDSIKIPDADKKIMQFVIDFGKEYGYSFETEADFDRYCLVNDAVYVAKNRNGAWTAVGTQFAVPYVFKTLFSHEPITFEDMCETKSVKSEIYLDMNEGMAEDEHNYIFVGKVGLFTPVKPGAGGGLLVRTQNDKYYSVVGTSGYRWMESEMVKQLGKEDEIDKSYYTRLLDEAQDTINKFGDFNMFAYSPSFDNSPEIKSDPLPESWVN